MDSSAARKREYGICGTCGETVGLTPSGKVVSHTFHGRRCRGSNTAPEEVVKRGR